MQKSVKWGGQISGFYFFLKKMGGGRESLNFSVDWGTGKNTKKYLFHLKVIIIHKTICIVSR